MAGTGLANEGGNGTTTVLVVVPRWNERGGNRLILTPMDEMMMMVMMVSMMVSMMMDASLPITHLSLFIYQHLYHCYYHLLQLSLGKSCAKLQAQEWACFMGSLRQPLLTLLRTTGSFHRPLLKVTPATSRLQLPITLLLSARTMSGTMSSEAEAAAQVSDRPYQTTNVL